jgi:hypothetical protein
MPTLAQTPAPAAPAAPTTVIQIPGPTLEALQAQAADISAQLAGLRAEKSILQQELRANRVDVAARPEAVARYAQLSEKVARAESDLDRVIRQISQREGAAVRLTPQGQIIVNPPSARRGPDPDMVVGMSFVLAMCLVLPLSIAMAKRIWRGKRDTGPIIEDRVSQRLDRLEQAVDTIAVEIERISEGQRFVTKVLVERPAAANVIPPSAETNNAAGLSEGKPFLALGAGPIEPIRMAERQAMRQSITPH